MARVLITGCSSGFGFEAAKTFRARGDEVFAGVRDLSGRTVGELRELGVTPVVIDVTDDVAVERGVTQVLAAGPLDALVNNAAIFLHAAVEETSDALAYRMFETNFFGPLRMSRAVLPSMRARRQGVIVNVSSVAGFLGMPGHGIYAATKFALVGMSEALYHEAKPFGVRVRVVEPGAFPTTEILRKALGSARHFGSPYQAHLDAFASAMSSFQKAAPSPDESLVIEAIWRAVHEPETPFQQPVGADAQAVAAARRAQPFEAIEAMIQQTLGLGSAS
ncbi:SDR family oxidoreductase [Sorangium atrum]|uniref:SDR family oxidoreductase n=1 Tax=Sorangium atrum TaxID=2995308 RepID=A0ABT5BYC0_9BACT|nr:SDR family oxidoreductase [Sorangium aterium]MDC0678428.1 SDR family oxidoreductase [Sorangium aterium]